MKNVQLAMQNHVKVATKWPIVITVENSSVMIVWKKNQVLAVLDVLLMITVVILIIIVIMMNKIKLY
jgi:hypothetical protein